MTKLFTPLILFLLLGGLFYVKPVKAQDAGVTGIIVPENNKCGASSTIVKVLVKNYGGSSLTNIPIVYDFGGTKFKDTLRKTLPAGSSDTVTVTSTVSTSSGGTWKTAAYTVVGSDADHTNDTSKILHIRFKPLSAPTVKDTTRCGPGPATLGSSPTKKPVQTRWYKDLLTFVPIGIGDTIATSQVKGDTFFYAQQIYDTITIKDSFRTRPSYSTTPRVNSGQMFDITPKIDIVIDSFAMWGFQPGGSTYDDVEVFYKEGTYKGDEKNSSAWTYVGTQSIVKKGFQKQVNFNVGKIKLTAGKTYGIYIRLKSEIRDIAYPCIYESTTVSPTCDHDSVRQNKDFYLTTGSSLEGNWGQYSTAGPSPTAYRDWDGQIYYSVGADCKSPRTKVNVKVKASPLSAKIIQSKPYQGYFSDGTIANPDLICPGDTVQYELQPPTGMKNTDLGTKWFITGISFKSVAGGAPFPKDTMTTPPNVIANGKFMFVPSVKAGDSTYILKIDMKMAGGCDGSITRVISVGSRPQPKFGFTQACVGQSMDLIDSSIVPTTGVNTYLYKMGNGDQVDQANGSYTYTKAGTYTITQYVTTSRGCFDSTTRTVVMYDKPVPKFGYISACEGKPFAFIDSTTTKGIASYLWRFGPKGATATTQNASYVYATAGTYKVWLVLTSKGGCKDSVSKTVTVLAKPKPGYSYVNACVGKTMKFTNTSTNSAGTVTYAWDFGDGFKSTLKDPDHAFLDPGTYDVRLVVTNSLGCRDTVIKQITPFTIPYADFRYTEVCVGDLTELFDSSENAASYTWDFGDKTTLSTQKNTKHKYRDPGTYTVTLAVKSADPAGCVDSMQRQVRVFAIPKAGFTAQSVCLGKATTFNNTSTGSGLSYKWTFEPGKTSTDQSPTYKFGTSGNHNVTLRVQSANGCADSITISVHVDDAPINTFSWVHYQDHPRNIKFTPGNSTFATYYWDFGDGATDSTNNKTPVHLFASATGKYVVTMVFIDASGCAGKFVDTVDLGKSGIAENKDKNINNVSVYPNPFNQETTVSYVLPARSGVHVEVQDMQGRVVAVLFDGKLDKGKHEHVFNAAQHNAAPGTYMLKVTVGESQHVDKIIYVK